MQQNRQKAMGQAVGGSFDEIGYLEKLLLIQYGLKPETDLVDVGCGSGRLLSQLGQEDVASYLGTDISLELFDKLVKSQIRCTCHFDHREKSYPFGMLRFKDFSSRLVGMTS